MMGCPEPGCDFKDHGDLRLSGERSYDKMYWHMKNHADVKGASKAGRTEEFTNAKESSV